MNTCVCTEVQGDVQGSLFKLSLQIRVNGKICF